MNTKREKPVVEVDGYLMRQYQPNANGMLMLWRCADVNKYKCRARGSSLFDSREVAVTNGHNGHLTDPSLATKYRARLTSGLNGKELNKLPRRSGIQQVIHRARKHADGSLVDRRPEHVRFSPFFRRTKDDQQFLRIDSRRTEPNLPVFFAFASPSGLVQLQRERRYSMDGRHCHTSIRVYVIGVHKGRSFLPCAFFVLPGKDQETKHIQKAGLMGVYCNAEVRPLLRYLWALAFLPPEDVLEAYEGLVVSLNALVARDVISQADVQRLNEFIRDYFERTYIRRFNARHVLVDPLFPIATWNVHAAVLEDGARTNNSQE
ncbi:hypothetical protein AAVH_30106, partial [Aphelenchoides avenae]